MPKGLRTFLTILDYSDKIVRTTQKVEFVLGLIQPTTIMQEFRAILAAEKKLFRADLKQKETCLGAGLEPKERIVFDITCIANFQSIALFINVQCC